MSKAAKVAITRRKTPAEAVAGTLAELEGLDARVREEIERLRREQAGLEDDSLRGLLIGEEDVDSWLDSLGGASDAVSPADKAQFDHLPPVRTDSTLYQLGALFGLNSFDLRVILTCLAPELHASYGGLYGYIQDDVTRKYATVDLTLSLWCCSLAERMAARARLHVGAPLRRHRLIMLADDSGPSPLISRSLALDPRITAFLLGLQDPDPILAPAARIYGPLDELPGHKNGASEDGHGEDVARLADLARPVVGSGRPWLDWADGATGGLRISMQGPDRGAKEEMAGLLASQLSRPLLIIDCPQLLAIDGPPGTVARIGAAFREALLQDAPLYLYEADALFTSDPSLARLQAALRRHLSTWPGLALLDLFQDRADIWPTPGPTVLRIDFALPPTIVRRHLWDVALEGAKLGPDVDLDLLSGSFRLNSSELAAAAGSARHSAAWHGPGEGVVTMRDLLAACRAHSNQQLSQLARKIVPRYTWRDLVLPADRVAQLREMCNNIHFGPMVYESWGFDRKLAIGKGLNVLFSGHPGTGKTMAAEVLSSDLGLDLYKIDLSTVVSKYIGETEKNLERIFREGRTSNAILFFDEADALFGKRSEVKDSHDRYANIEVGYLLQKMEEYDGICILATNLRKNLDEAFVRRLHGAIDFPMPEEEDRLRIWKSTFPPEAPIGASEADFAFLAARFKISGGNIKNIVLASAFLAAEEGTTIGMSHLVRATRREMQKIGKLIMESDFGGYYEMVRVGTL